MLLYMMHLKGVYDMNLYDIYYLTHDDDYLRKTRLSADEALEAINMIIESHWQLVGIRKVNE